MQRPQGEEQRNMPGIKVETEDPTEGGPGETDLHIVQVEASGELLGGGATCKIKQEPNEGLEQSWEGPRYDVPFPQPGWDNPQPSIRSQSGDIPKDFKYSIKGFTDTRWWPHGDWGAQAQLGIPRESHQADKIPDLSGNISERKILGKDTVSLEVRCWRFRRFSYWEAEGPQEVFGHLWELCRQWLQPERRTKEQILELVILEQFLMILPEEMQSWVKEHGPETGNQAAALAEDFLLMLKQSENHKEQAPFGQDLSDTTTMQLSTEAKEEGKAETTIPATDWQANVKEEPEEEEDLPLEGSEPGDIPRASWESAEGKCLQVPAMEPVPGRLQSQENHLENHPWKMMEQTFPCEDAHIAPPERAFQDGMLRRKRKRVGADGGKSLRQSFDLLEKQRLQTGEKAYKSSEWGKSLKLRLHLNMPERKYLGRKSSIWSDFGKKFPQPYDVPQPQEIQARTNKHVCSECGRTFSRQSHLLIHQRMHTGEKPYTCSECGKSFSYSSVLTEHERIHTGEKPYECSDCGQTFSRRSYLIQHERTHTGVKPYECAECQKCFTRRSGLLRHQKLHMAKKLG
ncbi:zinc finger protein 397-like isoform X2 [Rhineura floridana]|uniref:zinc finger protein 397-like isoform X2 n=1 Tax=Rhineura floridana TaxID=261503 RepID=UPI002AC87205|nr:zinc finger protein 397-like isoform X2 [Rhineura floridana]